MTEEYINAYIENLLRLEMGGSISEEDINYLLESHLANCPTKLYKYRECNANNLQVLRNNSIYIPFASQFLDPFDYTVKMDYSSLSDGTCMDIIDSIIYYQLKQVCSSNGIAINYSKSDIKAIREKYFSSDGTFLEDEYDKHPIEGVELKAILDALSTAYHYAKENEPAAYAFLTSKMNDLLNACRASRNADLVYCFSEDGNCPSMWEKYAQYYQGYCIEYDLSSWREKSLEEKKLLVRLLPTIYYQKEKPGIPLSRYLKVAADKIYGNVKEIPMELYIDTNKQMLWKSHDYDYENEWRLVCSFVDKQIFKFSFVSAIYMGKDIQETNIKQLQGISKELGVPLYKQSLNFYTNSYVYEKYD